MINERYSKHPSFPYGEVNGFVLGGTSVDANIKKEKLNTTEFGINLGLLQSRIMLDASYFMTTTTDLITYTTPSSFIRLNLIPYQHRGIEGFGALNSHLVAQSSRRRISHGT
ncbi:MAG: TonB-dependent receptor [Marinilabiliales bacterium]|nr:TonB-dependent receptor [Marinilabiliales bacterium]